MFWMHQKNVPLKFFVTTLREEFLTDNLFLFTRSLALLRFLCALQITTLSVTRSKRDMNDCNYDTWYRSSRVFTSISRCLSLPSKNMIGKCSKRLFCRFIIPNRNYRRVNYFEHFQHREEGMLIHIRDVDLSFTRRSKHDARFFFRLAFARTLVVWCLYMMKEKNERPVDFN